MTSVRDDTPAPRLRWGFVLAASGNSYLHTPFYREYVLTYSTFYVSTQTQTQHCFASGRAAHWLPTEHRPCHLITRARRRSTVRRRSRDCPRTRARGCSYPTPRRRSTGPSCRRRRDTRPPSRRNPTSNARLRFRGLAWHLFSFANNPPLPERCPANAGVYYPC